MPPVTHSGLWQAVRDLLEERALDLFDSEQYEQAIEVAKKNLHDIPVARFWQLRNCILIISAVEDVVEAQQYLDVAEDIWRVAKAEVTNPESVAHKYLAGLRGDLDEIVRDQFYVEVNAPAANDAAEGGKEMAEDDEMEADESNEEEGEARDEDDEGAFDLIAALRDSAHDPHRTPDLVRAAVDHHVL
ncbi:hypothetical protein Slin15195_G049960 [Septoria linicola]|uniref:Uncharacterized protein n=1 Tax=Septoria linicola TaxID=215465 RepID=A0A9Q9EJ21_9PEZI|nr:hypothetical protein Slin15195_G049960 [Septoria linicola]